MHIPLRNEINKNNKCFNTINLELTGEYNRTLNYKYFDVIECEIS